VGGVDQVQVATRLIAATNVVPEEAVAAGRFRADLESPHWFGDAANQTVYPATALDRIPPTQQIPLPENRTFVGAWGLVRP